MSNNLDSRANFFLAFENLMDALKTLTNPNLPLFPVIGPFSVAYPPLIFRQAPYRGPSVREKERPGVEIEYLMRHVQN